MADDLHGFITGPLWLRLKEDVRNMRVFSRQDLNCAAYFHIRRAVRIRPGWSCRARLPLANEHRPPLPDPDLALFSNEKLLALFQLEFHLTPDISGGFPTEAMRERMAFLRRVVEDAGQPRPARSGKAGRGYLVTVYDAEEEWFYADQTVQERQRCFWLPINCHDFADYADWRQRWERLALLPER